MAQRRMFSKTIVNSARFLMMPSTARLLYYDLGMAADDDGVVEAFAVMRMSNASEDDLRVLANKGFVKVLNEDMVSWITDWKTNNFIRTDRYIPSVYAKLLDDEMVGIPTVDQRYTNGRPSIGKDNIEIDKENINTHSILEMLHIDSSYRFDRSAMRATEKRLTEWITENTGLQGNILECVHNALEYRVSPDVILSVAMEAKDFYEFHSRLMAGVLL